MIEEFYQTEKSYFSKHKYYSKIDINALSSKKEKKNCRFVII